MRLAWMFLKRDAIIAWSYKVDMIFQVMIRLLLIVLFYFLLRSLPIPQSVSAFPGGVFPSIMIGVAFSDCVSVSVSVFAKQIREAQMTGSLEITLMSPVPLPLVLIYSSLWAYSFSALRFVFYLFVGSTMMGVNLSRADWLAALTVLVLTDVCFMGLGILLSSGVILFKRGDNLTVLMGDLLLFSSGVFFPIAVLPPLAQTLARLVPFTPALAAMRAALLTGASISKLLPDLRMLGIFTVVTMALGLFCFMSAVSSARKHGTLSEF
jgi:ABC-2 type transport system permease protein